MTNRFVKLSAAFFNRYSIYLACFSAFFIPIKLSIYLCAIIPLILSWIISNAANFKSIFRQKEVAHLIPLYIFIVIVAYSSFFGLDPIRSLRAVFSLGFFACAPLAFADSLRGRSFLWLLLCLICGEIIAATRSITEAAFPSFLPEAFLGKVAESGQLGIILVIVIGLVFYLRSRQYEKQNSINNPSSCYLLACLAFLALGLVAFSNYLGLENWQIYLIYLMVFAIFFALRQSVLVLYSPLKKQFALAFFIVMTALPTLSVALLVNLKRGPWAGVSVAIMIFLATFSRRLLAPVLLLMLSIFVFVTPVRERIMQSYNHFSISGGREVIWSIGFELAGSYPLGIGFKNSRVLRNFAPEIPPELSHFHNNLLNILVESGWLGVCVFLWWIIIVLRTAWNMPGDKNARIAARAIGCALVSWQVAGLVEYNFGDSEVLMVAFLMLGSLIALQRETKLEPNQAIVY